MGNIGPKLLKARKCYGHLGGTLGERLFRRFVELGWFELDPGKTTVYAITERGKAELEKLGVDTSVKAGGNH
jgi:hypothetical protein